MRFEEPKNKNYCAVVVALDRFVDLSNCNNLKAAIIFNNSVLVGKGEPAGAVGLFFPVETQLLPEFLANNNLYKHPEWGNVDPAAKGYFEQHGRVKALKFRGHKSEGFWIPIESLNYLGNSLDSYPVGTEFDTIGDHPVCKKYIARRNSVVGTGPKRARQPRLEDRIVENQFRFHPDTENLRRNIHKLTPDMWISVSDKWHGTSVVVANILIKRQLRWYERLARCLGVQVVESEYGLTWSSRRVVKGVGGEGKTTAVHYYDTDIWGVVAQEIGPLLPPGITVYAEIVGYTPTGAPIQPGYHYGCAPMTHKTMVYRVTHTNPAGYVLEFSWLQMKEFCAKYGLETVKEIYYGPIDLRKFITGQPPIGDLEAWQADTLRLLEKSYIREEMCPYNDKQVPAEGIVLKVESLTDDIAFKLKNFRFLEYETKQLDKGAIDIEEQVDPEGAGRTGI
jgi:RNA ligase